MHKQQIVGLASIIALLIFSIITWDVYGLSGFWISFDQIANAVSQTNQNPWLVAVAKAFALGFSAPAMVLVTLIISYYLWHKGRHKEATFLGCTMLLQAIIVLTLKYLLHRTRPENALMAEATYAFPSAHTVVGTVFCGLLLYLAWPYLETRNHRIMGFIAAAVLALAVGLSRVYLNVHWLSDVLGGLALGTCIVGGAVLLDQFFLLKYQ